MRLRVPLRLRRSRTETLPTCIPRRASSSLASCATMAKRPTAEACSGALASAAFTKSAEAETSRRLSSPAPVAARPTRTWRTPSQPRERHPSFEATRHRPRAIGRRRRALAAVGEARLTAAACRRPQTRRCSLEPLRRGLPGRPSRSRRDTSLRRNRTGSSRAPEPEELAVVPADLDPASCAAERAGMAVARREGRDGLHSRSPRLRDGDRIASLAPRYQNVVRSIAEPPPTVGATANPTLFVARGAVR
jgi:hypothetical protein